MPPPRAPESNDVKKFKRLQAQGVLPAEVRWSQVAVTHDSWCGVFLGRRCGCDPIVRLKAAEPPPAPE